MKIRDILMQFDYQEESLNLNSEGKEED